MSQPSQSFIRDIVSPIVKEIVEQKLLQKPQRPDMKFQIRSDASSAGAGKKLTKKALLNYLLSKEGKEALEAVIEVAKSVSTTNTLRKTKDFQEQRNDLRNAMIRPSGEIKNVVETIRQRTIEEFIVEEPRGEPIRKVGRPKNGEPKPEKKEQKKREVKEAKPPKVEKVEVPVMPKQPEMKIAGADFSRDEVKDVRQRLSEETRLTNPVLNAAMKILQQGASAIDKLFKAKQATRINVRNVAAGLALVGQVAGLSDKQRLKARNLARLVGAGAIARASIPKFSRSSEDFDDDGTIRAEALRDAREGRLPRPPPEAPEDAPETMANIDRARGNIEDMIDTMEQATEAQRQALQARTGMNVDNVIEDLKAQTAQIGQTNQLTQAQTQLADFANLETVFDFLMAVSAIAVGLGLRAGTRPQDPSPPPPPQPPAEPPAQPPAEPPATNRSLRTRVAPAPSPPRPPARPPQIPPDRPIIPIFPEQRTATDAKLRRRPPPRPFQPRLPAPEERLALPDPEEVRKREERTKKEDKQKKKEKLFTSKQIVEQQNETKQPQQARPDVIIPAQKVLDPYKDEKDQKADFEIEAGFGFDIPFAMNGVILEDNALMQQHLLEEELIYRNAGIDRGNNDWDDPAEVGFQKPGNPSAVPDLKFEENYQDKPVNPNNTFKQNIMYNTMTPVLDQRGQGESLRESTLFGEQPTF
jgi:hypothetical protein